MLDRRQSAVAGPTATCHRRCLPSKGGAAAPPRLRHPGPGANRVNGNLLLLLRQQSAIDAVVNACPAAITSGHAVPAMAAMRCGHAPAAGTSAARLASCRSAAGLSRQRGWPPAAARLASHSSAAGLLQQRGWPLTAARLASYRSEPGLGEASRQSRMSVRTRSRPSEDTVAMIGGSRRDDRRMPC